MRSKPIRPFSRRFPSPTAPKGAADATGRRHPPIAAFGPPHNFCVTIDVVPFPDPARLEARLALSAQLAALATVLARLERARARVPGGGPSGEWRGPAQAAYGASVRQLGGQVDEAIDAVRAAKRYTARAIATLGEHG
jgi:hypothetical protein